MLKNLNLDMNMSDNVKYGLGLAVALVASLLCFMFVIYPLYKDNIAMKAKLTQSNARLATLQTFAGQNQNYDALVKIQKMKVAAAQKKLPDTVSVPELLSEYSQIAEAAGVRLESLTPGKVAKEGNAFALPISVTLQGDYFKLITFLQRMENADRFVVVRGAEYDAEKTGENLKMKATFTVFTLKNVQGAPGASAAKPAATSEAKKSTDQRIAETAQNVTK